MPSNLEMNLPPFSYKIVVGVVEVPNVLGKTRFLSDRRYKFGYLFKFNAV